MTAPIRLTVVLLGILAVGAGAPAPAGPPTEVRGTWRLHGTARVALGSLLDRDVELHADAILAPGDRPGDVRVRVVAEGYGCDLVARLEEGGALSFAPGQRCDVVITAPDARGRLQAQLRDGRGRLDGPRLALSLSGDVEGTLRRQTSPVRVLGQELPATWTPDLPVRGHVTASAEGDVDRSRAAQRP